MFNTPILFTVFNRLNTVKKVFGQIRKIQPTQLFISADGPRVDKPNEIEKCNNVRNWIMDNIDWDCDVKTKFNDENMGCKYAMYSAFKWFFSFVEQGIILEDDCYPDLSFFPYCEELLNKYRDNPNIRSISGRNNITSYYPEKQSYYFTTRGDIWGWGTWKREMDTFNPDNKLPDEKTVYNKLLEFSKDPDESKLHAEESQKILLSGYSSWAYPWDIFSKLEKKINVTPAVNLVKNIGFGPSGTHSGSERSDFAMLKSMKFPLKHPINFDINYDLSKKIFDIEFNLPKEKFWLIKKIFRKIKRIIKASI